MKHQAMLSALILLVGTSAFARPIFKCDDGKYTVTIDQDTKTTATVFQNGQKAQFGDLRCSDPQIGSDNDGETTETVSCRSTGVADAGFIANLSGVEGEFFLDLSEETFGGPISLGQLDCSPLK